MRGSLGVAFKGESPSPFMRQDDSRMSRKEVLETGFLVPAMPDPGPTLKEEHQIWLNKVFCEVQDKSEKLTRK
jgi:hypothetical protein